MDKKIAKALKKARKAEVKRLKKATPDAPGPAGAAAAPIPKSEPSPTAGPTPAERSAAAAERQVVLHRRRMWISLVGVLVAAATLIFSLRHQLFPSAPQTPTEQPPNTTQP